MCRTVLFVEDEPAGMKGVVKALTNAGYEVEEARDGSEAFAMLASKAYTVVLLDIIMPHGDEMPASIPAFSTGVEILRQIREGRFAEAGNGPRTKVVALTAIARDRELADVRSLNPDCLIEKPVDPVVLVARLDAVVKTTQGATTPPSSGR